MIDKTQIGISPLMWMDNRTNWFSTYKLHQEELPAIVEECWHFHELYYCDGLFRVPVPSTSQGKPVFYTGIISNADKSNLIGFEPHQEASPLDGDERIVRAYARIEKSIPAKFAEVIVATKEWLDRDCDKRRARTGKTYEIINFHGLPYKDVPQHPMEIAKNLAGPHQQFCRYSPKDMTDAIVFWSHHSFVRGM